MAALSAEGFCTLSESLRSYNSIHNSRATGGFKFVVTEKWHMHTTINFRWSLQCVKSESWWLQNRGEGGGTTMVLFPCLTQCSLAACTVTFCTEFITIIALQLKTFWMLLQFHCQEFITIVTNPWYCSEMPGNKGRAINSLYTQIIQGVWWLAPRKNLTLWHHFFKHISLSMNGTCYHIYWHYWLVNSKVGRGGDLARVDKCPNWSPVPVQTIQSFILSSYVWNTLHMR